MHTRQGFPVSNLHVCLTCRAIAQDTAELFTGAKKCSNPHTVPWEPRDMPGAFMQLARELDVDADDYAGVVSALLKRLGAEPVSALPAAIAKQTIERMDRKLHDLRNDWQAEKLRADVAEAKLKLVATPESDVWRWGGDVNDSPESMGDEMTVVMSGRKARELAADAKAYGELAHALGMELEADGHASEPAPVKDCVAAIKELRAHQDRAIDLQTQVEAAAIDARRVARVLGVTMDATEEPNFVRDIGRAETAATHVVTVLRAYADTEDLAAQVRKELYPDANHDPFTPKNPAATFRVLQQRYSGALRTIQAAAQYIATLLGDATKEPNTMVATGVPDLMSMVREYGARGAEMEQSRLRIARALMQMTKAAQVALGDLTGEEEDLLGRLAGRMSPPASEVT
jgi:hypothetical protein